MMQNKESFVFYKSWWNAIKDLPNDVRLEILDGINEYALSGILPEFKPMAKLAFSFIKDDLDRSSTKYKNIVDRNRENGKNGGRPKTQKNPMGILETQEKPNDNDNDNDNVNDNVIVTLKENKVFNFEFVEEYLQIPFHTWLQYKSEIGQPYNSQIALEKCYSELENLSGKNSKTAYEIVDGCISANSRSLYKKKDFSSPKTEVKPHKFNFKDADR